MLIIRRLMRTFTDYVRLSLISCEIKYHQICYKKTFLTWGSSVLLPIPPLQLTFLAIFAKASYALATVTQMHQEMI